MNRTSKSGLTLGGLGVVVIFVEALARPEASDPKLRIVLYVCIAAIVIAYFIADAIKARSREALEAEWAEEEEEGEEADPKSEQRNA